MGAVAHLTEPRAVQTCSLAGIDIMKGRLLRLENLGRAIRLNVADIDAASTRAELIRSGLLGLQLIKASCDAVMSIAGEFPQFKAVSAGHSALTPSADMLGKGIVARKIAAGDFIRATGAGASAAAGGSVRSGAAKDVIELKKLQTDLVVDAASQVYEALVQDLAGYGAKLTTMTLVYARRGSVARFVAIGKAMIDGGLAFAKAYKEFRDDDVASALAGAKKSLFAQEADVRRRIEQLKGAITACELELSSRKLRLI